MPACSASFWPAAFQASPRWEYGHFALSPHQIQSTFECHRKKENNKGQLYPFYGWVPNIQDEDMASQATVTNLNLALEGIYGK